MRTSTRAFMTVRHDLYVDRIQLANHVELGAGIAAYWRLRPLSLPAGQC